MNKNSNSSRRDFLKSSAYLAASAAVLGETTVFGAGGAAKWPVSCRDVHLKEAGQGDCWAAMKFLGLSGVEASVNEELALTALSTPTRKYSVATDDGIKRVKEDLAANGMAITAFCMGNRLDERLEQEVDWARRLAQAAEKMGVSAVRIDVYPRKLTGDAAVVFSINACKRLCEAAKGTALRFGIENHGKFTNDPAVLEKLFDGVGSDKLGLTMDFMNFYWFGHPLNDIYGICEKFASRAFHTHCKNLKYPDDQKNVRREVGWQYGKYSAPLYEGDVDYARMAQILRKAGYRGDLCLENECLGHFPKDEHPQVLKKEIELLRSLA
jgi:sugar phosphate isomerase/epimerase